MSLESYKPEYFDEIPDEAGGQGAWYASEVLEFIIELYRFTNPELYSAVQKEYVQYCTKKGREPGEVSPRLGVFFNGWAKWFIGYYMTDAKEKAKSLYEKFRNSTIERELDFWHHYSLKKND